MRKSINGDKLRVSQFAETASGGATEARLEREMEDGAPNSFPVELSPQTIQAGQSLLAVIAEINNPQDNQQVVQP